jgi:hypothetical protein
MAKLTLTDGKQIYVSVKLPISGKLMEAFNTPDAFMDVILGDGTQCMLSKATIARAESADPPKASLNQLRRSADKAGFNAHAVLGVDKAAGPEEVREAYMRLVKSYHPDRFAGIDMPQEMKDYATAMLARINMAYQQLS